MLINEEIEPSDLIQQMEMRYQNLQRILEEKQKTLSNFPADLPKGKIRIVKHGQSYHYFIHEKGNKKGKYIPVSKIQTVKHIAEKEYLRRLILRLEKQSKVLEKASSVLRKNPLPQITEARTALFTPASFPDRIFERKWQTIQNPAEKRKTEFVTERGETVCSKSELMIANALNRRKIAYHYEMPLSLKGYGTIHPDFLCLNARTHKEIIWEHFGMMSDPKYAEKAVAKLHSFSNNGFTIGKNLILSFETSGNPLSTVTINKMIDDYLV